jgi:uncharacterized membrane protein YsdA (DUF1294 family)
MISKELLYFVIVLILINIIAFIFFGIDKRKAIKNKWRIKESLLLLLSVLGGGFGSYLGMNFFHHKTQKPKFKFGVPIITILIYGLLIFLIVYYWPSI